MADVKLHRCAYTFLPAPLDSCRRVQDALDEQGITYEVIKEPSLPRSRRKDLIELSGQKLLPVVEFADGSPYRDESREMAATIRAGKLFEQQPPSDG